MVNSVVNFCGSSSNFLIYRLSSKNQQIYDVGSIKFIKAQFSATISTIISSLNWLFTSSIHSHFYSSKCIIKKWMSEHHKTRWRLCICKHRSGKIAVRSFAFSFISIYIFVLSITAALTSVRNLTSFFVRLCTIFDLKNCEREHEWNERERVASFFSS